jgi:DMSO/TMAO reductase YedYZ heme-binding membrane subunit
VPTTSGRARGRQGVHSGAQGAAGDHPRKIMATMVAATVIIVFMLVFTKVGRDIDAATQHFMLYYAGVFALLGLTGSVFVGLVATDRIVMKPGHRVMAQAVHRAVSFGALAFLVIHIVTEILAQRAHVIDAFIPFLSPFRTFYIGLGTIASDLILLIVMTSILRKRFTAHGKAWRWRAIHYSSYAAFVFGVLHGLLGGREAKPYVDWSYGFAIAVTALGLAVRFLAISLRPKENLSSAPGADRSRAPGAEPLHAAAMSMAQARLGGTVQLPAGMAAPGAGFGPTSTGPWAALPAASAWSSPSGPLPALEAAPVYASGDYASYAPADAYQDLGFIPLGAPPYGDDASAGLRSRPNVSADRPRRPLYEPGYDGPPRFEGAPRRHVPQDELSSYPYGQPGHWQPSGSGDYAVKDEADRGRPRPSRAIEPPGSSSRSGPPAPPRPGDRNTGPIPRHNTGPMPRAGTGALPRTGEVPVRRTGSGPMPRAGTGPMPRPDTGPIPRTTTGPMPRTGPPEPPTVDPAPVPRTGRTPRAGAPTSHRKSSADPRYREVPGANGSDEWR